jgi:hypothetical protein
MRHLLISIGVLSWLGPAAVLVAYQPPFEPDREGYEQCRKLYPQCYCTHAYLDPR